MTFKIICLVICAAMLFVCYRAQFFAERVLKLKEASEKTILRIKLGALIISMALFICTMIFMK